MSQIEKEMIVLSRFLDVLVDVFVDVDVDIHVIILNANTPALCPCAPIEGCYRNVRCLPNGSQVLSQTGSLSMAAATILQQSVCPFNC